MRDLLVDAAIYIQVHGWCQGEFRRDGKACLFTALMLNSDAPLREKNMACEYLSQYLDTTSIVWWNDKVCKSREQAIEALLGAARMAQIGEPQRRYEVIPIHTPPVETPPEPKAPVVNPEKVEPEKVD